MEKQMKKVLEIQLEYERGVPSSVLVIGGVTGDEVPFVLAALNGITKQMESRLKFNGLTTSNVPGELRESLIQVINDGINGMDKEEAKRFVKDVIVSIQNAKKEGKR